jgi:hypothetical protein
MNKREAMREAHRIVAVWIYQAQQSTDEGWSEDETEDAAIDAALTELSRRHQRAAEKPAKGGAS